MRENYIEIEELDELREVLAKTEVLRHYAFQAVNFEKCGFPVENYRFEDCLFMGIFTRGKTMHSPSIA